MEFNRRTALGALGGLGVSAIRSMDTDAQEMPSPLPPLVSPGPIPPPPQGGVRGRMSGAKAAAKALALEGVPCVFGVPGAQSNELWDAFKSVGVPYFLVTNESASSVMADASARLTGRVGAFSVVPGPGLTNAMTGIGEAWLDTVPIVGLVTDVKRGPFAPVGQVHGLFNTAILRTVTKTVIEVHHQGQIPGAIHQAFRMAKAGPPGPTGVVIPYHLYTEVWDYNEPVPIDLPPPWNEAAFRQATRILADRRLRVGIFAGMGCFDAADRLTAVAELLQAPVATTVSGKGVIPDAHPLAVGWGYGPYGTRAAENRFKDVDVVLAVGTRYSEVSTANYSVPSHPYLIHVDIDPNVLGRNVRAERKVGLNADAGMFFDRLLAEADTIGRPLCPPLWQQIRSDRADDYREHAQVRIATKVDPMYFLHHLNQQLGPGGLVFVDVTASTHWAAEAFQLGGPRQYFAPADNQSMGWAIPASVGAQRIRPDLRVACVTGDGCFLMSGLEASTASRSYLPVKFFVLDDGVYHYMQMLQSPTYGRTTATELARLDYAALARGLGLGFNQIASNDEIVPGLQRAFAMPGPVLTRVIISYEGRDIRWLDALKSTYIDQLSTGQKARFAGRLALRTLDPRDRND